MLSVKNRDCSAFKTYLLKNPYRYLLVNKDIQTQLNPFGLKRRHLWVQTQLETNILSCGHLDGPQSEKMKQTELVFLFQRKFIQGCMIPQVNRKTFPFSCYTASHTRCIILTNQRV